MNYTFNDKHIPAELKRRPQWVCWRDGKIPISPQRNAPASVTNPNHWTDYATAANFAIAGHLGLGFVFNGDGVIGVDLDHCRNADTGKIEPWALTIVTELDSYTEVSPSGTGVHVYALGSLPDGRRKKDRIEAYSMARFFTVTGEHLAGTPLTVEKRESELHTLYRTHLADPEPITASVASPQTVFLSDDAVIGKCRAAKNKKKFETLWCGQWNGEYTSQSEADLALVAIFRFYTQDARQLDRLFRQSKLYRPKWDEKHGGRTYGENTINEALKQSGEIYKSHVQATAQIEQFLNAEMKARRQDASPSIPRENDAQLHSQPELARKPSILQVFEGALGVQGVVGEMRLAKLVYLAVTSRLLARPVSLVVKGLSSSGKSFTTQATLKFFPPAACFSMTGMSEKALVYMIEEFQHRTIVLFEATALQEQREKRDGNQTAMFVRTLLSEGRLEYYVPTKQKDGSFLTTKIVKEGPTNLIVTTTANELHGENETRMLSVPTNDTQEQTRAIMRAIARDRRERVDFSHWHHLQQWLSEQENEVFVPFADYLAEAIPPAAVRLRRDFPTLLSLIQAHALLHQATREKDEWGRIVAEPADYHAVRGLVHDLMASSVKASVSKTIRETVQAVQLLDKGDGVKKKELSHQLKLDESAISRRANAAEASGFLVNLEEKRNKPKRWAMGEPLPEDQPLLPERLAVRGDESGVQPPLHSASGEPDKGSRGGVRVCSHSVAIESPNEEVIDLAH